MKNFCVAVYGTLKGMDGRNGELLGTGVTKESFTMWDGSFPVVVHETDSYHQREHAGPLRVEVYMVHADQMQHLDRYEGYPSLYTRRETEVCFDKGGTVKAWVYVGNGIRKHLNTREIIVPNEYGELYWAFGSEVKVDRTISAAKGA
jgi:gamma-glutamylcyclotransferase (GGCT)/AIG2-like uncharacterized protein YtfP